MNKNEEIQKEYDEDINVIQTKLDSFKHKINKYEELQKKYEAQIKILQIKLEAAKCDNTMVDWEEEKKIYLKNVKEQALKNWKDFTEYTQKKIYEEFEEESKKTHMPGDFDEYWEANEEDYESRGLTYGDCYREHDKQIEIRFGTGEELEINYNKYIDSKQPRKGEIKEKMNKYLSNKNINYIYK